MVKSPLPKFSTNRRSLSRLSLHLDGFTDEHEVFSRANKFQSCAERKRRLECWIDQTLPALERILIKLGLFVVFAVGLITIVILLVGHT